MNTVANSKIYVNCRFGADCRVHSPQQLRYDSTGKQSAIGNYIYFRTLADLISALHRKVYNKMRRIFEILFLLLICFNADLDAQELFGDWIKTNVTYLNDNEFPDEHVLKYQYLRYTFEKSNELFMSVKSDDKGTALLFNINSNILQVKNSYGFIINSFLIDKITNDELILIQKGKGGFNESDCIKYQFIKEKLYQNKLPIKPSNILLISGIDTIYKSSEKIHAKFNGDKSFSEFCSDNIPEMSVVMATNNLFVATFIVRKSGQIDSVQILENINKRFEKQFRKALNKSKNLWLAAELNNEKVDVQMSIQFKFVTSNKFIPMYNFFQKGKVALDNLDYLRALEYFELALEKIPDSYEITYYKAICEMNLGNIDAACEDLAKVKSSGKMNVEELIIRNCVKK